MNCELKLKFYKYRNRDIVHNMHSDSRNTRFQLLCTLCTNVIRRSGIHNGNALIGGALATDRGFFLISHRLWNVPPVMHILHFAIVFFGFLPYCLNTVGKHFLENFLKFDLCAFCAFLRPYQT